MVAVFCKLFGFAWIFQEVDASTACLPNARSPSQRNNLTSNSESYPIGLFIQDWDANYVTSNALHILLEELLGYNVIQTGPGSATPNAFYALMGCPRPTDLLDAGCAPDLVTYNHVNLEDHAARIREITTKWPSTAPVDLGSMGYDGTISTYFPRSVLVESHFEDGAVLQHYRGWNASWSHNEKYFDSLASIDRSLLRPCNETRFMASTPNEDYLRVTGDMAGLQRQPNGDLVAFCPDGYWWLSPACRGNASRCIPYVTVGVGWFGLDDMMQKVTAYDMPVAIALPRSWAEFPKQVKSTFYWWIPDGTFVDLDPVDITFPPYDFNAYLIGDKRTSAATTAITKLVSQDLSSLAPNVVELVRNMRWNKKDVMDMMREWRKTGDSLRDVACRWLQANPNSWSSWLPDKTKCFPGFGLYNTKLEAFTNIRNDPNDLSFLECRACVSGRHSEQMEDDKGMTYECKPCEPGTSQPSGAALVCEPCQLGEYQNNSGSQSCNRCDIGQYQDQKGSSWCHSCDGGTTLGFGSISRADCGCPAGYINVESNASNLSCVECGEGFDCPALSTLTSLISGSSTLGDQFVPSVRENFYSVPEDPLAAYRCLGEFRCPGGAPGSCSSSLQGTACTDCPQGQSWSNETCTECTTWQIFGWVAAIVLVCTGLIVSYYALTSQSTAKASVLFTTTCAFGMTINALQSVGIIGMMTVKFPANLTGIYEFFQIFLLDIDSLGFGCIAGGFVPLRYIASACFFPGAVLYLLVCQRASYCLPFEYRWAGPKTWSCIGAVLQVGFSTMSTIALAPLMCFSHPNGVHSVLKYPSITCGTPDHTLMLVAGLLLLLFFVLGFLTVCTYAVLVVPTWSSKDQGDRVQAFRFLLGRFRLDSWWFGVALLARGPLMSLPIALATDYPPVQIVSVMLIFMIFLIMETRAWPWKVPLLNVLDCFTGFCIIVLVASNALHIGTVEGAMKLFVDALGTVTMGLLGTVIFLLLIMTSCALCFQAALGGQNELCMFNLQTLPPASLVTATLQSTASKLAQLESFEVSRSVSRLAVYDVNLLLSAAALIASEVTFDQNSPQYRRRIRSSSFAPTGSVDSRAQVPQGQKDQKDKDLCQDEKNDEPVESNTAEPDKVTRVMYVYV